MYMYTQTNTVNEKKTFKEIEANQLTNSKFYNIFIQVLQEVDDFCYVINTLPLLYIF